MDAWQSELTDLGLTGYQARVYLALLHRSHYTAPQLARESAVPHQRIYDVLATLAERGLVTVVRGKVTRYTATDPASAIEQLTAAHRTRLSEREQTATRLIAALSPAWSRGQAETDPLDYVQVLRDRETLTKRIEEIQARASTEILAMTKLPYLTSENRNAIATIDRLTRTGGTVRCLYERAGLAQPGVLAGIRRHAAAGEQARAAESLPLRMWIVDRSDVLISLTDPVADSASATNVWVEHPALAQTLVHSFETLWAGARPIH